MKTLGLYIHIPFCRSKCLYCDFCSFPRPDRETLEAYTNALCRDLSRRAENCRDYTVDTVYFGGGTPTYLPIDLFTRVLNTVFASYRVCENAEITAECNPATGGKEYFAALRSMGLNRLSIGLQSADPTELRALGRVHRFDAFVETWNAARKAGIENLSADVMFGIPEQTEKSYRQTLELLCALSPTHISAYGLMIEEGTPFYRLQTTLRLPDEESTRRMYFEGIEFLEARGLSQYEISNFAKRGYESRHNIKYWNCDPYLGFGPAAHSDFEGARFGNVRDLVGYMEDRPILEEHEVPPPSDRMQEYVMLRMRLTEGVDAADFNRRFGSSFEQCFGVALSRYIPLGLVTKTVCGYAFTKEGLYLSNAVLSEILDFSK